MRVLPSKSLCLLVVSAFSLVFSIILFCFKTQIFNTILHSQLIIKEGTASYNAFVETPVPVLTKIYFFDMVNPRDLFHKHEKPILEERGPYTFRESQRKVNMVWHPNGTVTYQRKKYWYFERSLSVGPLSDVITTINVPVVGSAEFVRGSFFMEWGISDMLSTLEATIFVRKTVEELLFEGYQDTVMELGSTFAEDTGGDYEDYDMYDDEDDENDDDEDEDDSSDNDEDDTDKVVLDKFGWFYKRNGTSWSDGDIEMVTGEGDIDSLGQIVSWNNQTTTEAYDGDCSRLRGSTDGLFPPGLADITDSISLFSTDLCRPLHFTKSGFNSLHGIPVTTFELDPDNFANSSVCPSNVCYNNNIPSGVQNVTHCKRKSPTFVSRPHFYLADPSYLDQFQYGLSPDPERHSSVFWLEAMSSIPLKVNIRLQLNILLRKVEGIEYLFRDVQEVMFPVLWLETLSELPEEMAGSLNLLIMLPTIMQLCATFSLITSILIISVILACQSLERQKQRILLKEARTMKEPRVKPECLYSQIPTLEQI